MATLQERLERYDQKCAAEDRYRQGKEEALQDARPMSRQNALRAIIAGNATITVKNARTGAHYTYEVSECPDKPGQLWFVSLQVEPGRFEYMGCIWGGKEYKHGRKSLIGQDAPGAIAFWWTWEHLRAGTLPDAVEIWHSGTCCRCGKRLTDPESIERGLGPQCAGLVGTQHWTQDVHVHQVKGQTWISRPAAPASA